MTVDLAWYSAIEQKMLRTSCDHHQFCFWYETAKTVNTDEIDACICEFLCRAYLHKIMSFIMIPMRSLLHNLLSI